MDEAKIPHNPKIVPLKAATHNPEPHLPGPMGHELGTELHPESITGHPGFTCDQLPPGHVHPLPKLDSKHRHQKSGKDPETPPASPLAEEGKQGEKIENIFAPAPTSTDV